MKILEVQDNTDILGSAAILFYFAAVLVITQFTGSFRTWLYYLSAFLCVLAMVPKRDRVPGAAVVLCAGTFLLSIANMAFVGNMTFQRTIVLVLSFGIGCLFVSGDLDRNFLKAALYLSMLVVVYRFARFGIGAKVYVSSSNNYISVYLLAPAILYYLTFDGTKEKLPILPAFLMWVLSLLAGGRGGFVACTIMFLGILCFRFFGESQSAMKKVLLGGAVLFLLVPLAAAVIPAFVSGAEGLRLVSRFSDIGMTSDSRIIGWTEYIESLRDPVKLFFGSNLRDLPWAARYNANIHNSFLFVHAYLGIIGFAVMLAVLIKDAVYGIRNRRWMYLMCLGVFCFRSFTDHVFGANRISPVIICLLLYPFILEKQKAV